MPSPILEGALASININLTAGDRQRYRSINEQNKLFVNKVFNYHKGQPNLLTEQLDWAEYERDHKSRAKMGNFIRRQEALVIKLKNAKTLHYYDNFQAAMVDYAYISFMAGTGSVGFENKQKATKQFFLKTPPAASPAGPEQ